MKWIDAHSEISPQFDSLRSIAAVVVVSRIILSGLMTTTTTKKTTLERAIQYTESGLIFLSTLYLCVREFSAWRIYNILAGESTIVKRMRINKMPIVAAPTARWSTSNGCCLELDMFESGNRNLCKCMHSHRNCYTRKSFAIFETTTRKCTPNYVGRTLHANLKVFKIKKSKTTTDGQLLGMAK